MRSAVITGSLCVTLAACSWGIDAPDPLSSQEYTTIRNEIVELANAQDPKAALTSLRATITEHPRVVSVCHALVHEVGNAAYDRYRSFPEAMRYLDELCNAGYMHGVIERMLETSPDAMRDLPALCDGYEESSLHGWQCFHGIGHGLMLVHENDLPKALEACGALKTEHMQAVCRNGAFMENFSIDGSAHRSRYVSLESPRFPCAEQAEADKASCYVYVPTYFLGKNPGEYDEALDWCLDSETQWRGLCVSGVGSEALKQNVDNPALVERLCARAGKFEADCMGGAIDLARRHFGTLEDSLAFCDGLRRINRDRCRGIVESDPKMFE
jgi:hypothetical protein